MSFEFLDRGDMRIKFSHDGVSHELDAGVRPKREGSYLDNRLVGTRMMYVPRGAFLHGNGWMLRDRYRDAALYSQYRFNQARYIQHAIATIEKLEKHKHQMH